MEACALNVIIYAVFIGLGFRFIITFTFATDCLAGPAYNGPNRKNHIRYAKKPYTYLPIRVKAVRLRTRSDTLSISQFVYSWYLVSGYDLCAHIFL